MVDAVKQANALQLHTTGLVAQAQKHLDVHMQRCGSHVWQPGSCCMHRLTFWPHNLYALAVFKYMLSVLCTPQLGMAWWDFPVSSRVCPVAAVTAS